MQNPRLPNPWLNLPSASPFVLPGDAAAVKDFNRGRAQTDKHFIHLDFLPVPFVGDPLAPVLLLTANPSVRLAELAAMKREERGPYGLAILSSMLHTSGNHQPFFYVDPAFATTTGYWYWHKKMRELIDVVGANAVGLNVLEVEFFPYRSVNFHSGVSVPSQTYSRELVRDAIGRQAVVVGMRSRAVWERAVPQLLAYKSAFWLTNVRRPYLSKKQLSVGFNIVAAALKSPGVASFAPQVPLT